MWLRKSWPASRSALETLIDLLALLALRLLEILQLVAKSVGGEGLWRFGRAVHGALERALRLLEVASSAGEVAG